MTVHCSAEFLIEPFKEGEPGPHVEYGITAMEEAGLDVTIGPFGSSVSGPVPVVTEALARMLTEAMAAGASRISVQVSQP